MNSYQPKALLNDLQYYITPPHDCSYLPNKSARMVFLDPAHRIDVVTLSELSRTGFRRSGDFVYRPECHLCRQCLSSRVPVAEFRMNSSQKKAWKRSQDLVIKITSPEHAGTYIMRCMNAILMNATQMATCSHPLGISSKNFYYKAVPTASF